MASTQLLILQSICIISLCINNITCHGGHLKSKVLILSFDGLRHDYLKLAEEKKIDVSNFRLFEKEGVHPSHIMPVYPTSTMPNHWALLTGLYPNINGIVDNNFHDPRIGATFDFYNAECMSNATWFKGLNLKPLWLINQENGYMSSSMMWPATAVKINGSTPKFVYGIDRFDDYPSIEYRIDKILEWLSVSSDSTLGFLYFPEPDEAGHRTGPASEMVMKKLKYLNEAVGYLYKRIKDLDLDTLNILFWSDHGMTDTDPSKEIYLDEMLTDPTDVFHVGNNIWTPKDKVVQVYKELKTNAKHGVNFKVYRREEPPADLIYGRHYRIGPIFMVTNLGYYLLKNASLTRKNAPPDTVLLGDHGYETKHSDMWPYFFAWGPAFKSNYTPKEPPHTVDIYLLVCTILQLHNCPPTNGSLARVNDLLIDNGDQHGTLSLTFITYIATFSFCGLVAVVLCLVALTQFTTRYAGGRNQRKQQYRITDMRDKNSDVSRELLDSDIDSEI